MSSSERQIYNADRGAECKVNKSLSETPEFKAFQEIGFLATLGLILIQAPVLRPGR